MRTFPLLVGPLALALLTAAPDAQARRVPEKRRPAFQEVGKVDLNELNMEVNALQTLHQLRATPAQLRDLARRAASTAEPPHPRKLARAGDEYQKALSELRSALARGDADRIDRLNDELDKLHAREKPEFDDGVDVTDAAREQAPKVLRLLSARQVAGYVADYADTFPDPRERLTEALEEVRKSPDKEWRDLRDDVADHVASLVAGLDKDAEGRVRDEVGDLLDRARRLKPDEFTKRRPELEKAIDRIVARVGPTDVLRHFMEHTLAELLSNPRLAAAAEARLKKGK